MLDSKEKYNNWGDVTEDPNKYRDLTIFLNGLLILYYRGINPPEIFCISHNLNTNGILKLNKIILEFIWRKSGRVANTILKKSNVAVVYLVRKISKCINWFNGRLQMAIAFAMWQVTISKKNKLCIKRGLE